MNGCKIMKCEDWDGVKCNYESSICRYQDGSSFYWKEQYEKVLSNIAALEAARETVADQQIELVQLRKDYDSVKGLLIKAREKIAALTAERDALLKEIEIKGISWRASQAKVEELLISNAKKAEVIEGLREKYNDLIMEVERKYPNETRHETAKRYIREREAIADCNSKQAALKGKKETNHDPT